VIFTDWTEADAVAAVGFDAWDLSSASYFEPFWRMASFAATDDFGLKNATQFFLIAAVAAAPLVASVDAVAEGEGAAVVATGVGEAGAEDGAADDGEAATELLELLELLEQAVMAAASARPSAGTSRLRRAI
jgi:hypothetical protein